MAKVRNHKTFIDDRGSFTPIDLNCGPKSADKWLQANISVNPNRTFVLSKRIRPVEKSLDKSDKE